MKTKSLIAALGLLIPATAHAQAYAHEYQYATGDRAQFDMIGPATTGNSNGDALIQSVTMPNGEVFDEFYRPVAISHFSFAGNANNFKARAGSDSTVGVKTTIALKDVDGNGSSQASEEDIAGMPQHILNVLENENLNNYIDTSTNDGWEFVMKFDLPLMDDDVLPDDFGELLYFERGDGGGNSWMTFLAVDQHNNPLPGATPLAISPEETVLTTPRTVLAGGQDMGAVAIDLSRLGVTETSYLRVMRSDNNIGGFVSGGETKADFKIMAVITNPSQLTLRRALYD